MVANQLVYEVAKTDETYQLMLKRLQELSLELKEIKNTNDQSKILVVDSCTVNENSQAVVDASQVLLMNPNISQTKERKRKVKGYKGSTRIKGGLEKGTAKATKVKTCRRCTCCNQAHFTNGLPGKVTRTLLEMDQTEVLHLIESPDALKKKAEDAVRLVSSRCDAADQLGSLSLKD
ncbi:hypothetical protein IFM89_003071 [Coptis chinensis]|uniref:PABC domain-containing protein n=1 Tax=Coptis chinensis TaxID=261450 RepID=A0A835I8P1_9MAGN|nr:hypothetical protein IFM89_003071 [Coptis chinensis]